MISEISAILSSVKTATDIAKLLQQSDLSLEKAETKLKLADLIGALADAKIQIAEVREHLHEKDEVIRKLQGDLELKQNLVYEKPYYWVSDGDGKDGPFCQKCYDADKKLIRLQTKTKGYWTCASCHEHYEDSSYQPPSIAVARVEPSRSSRWQGF